MKTSGFNATMRHRDGTAVIDLSGEVNRASEPALSTAYEEATRGNDLPVLLDFSNVEYINSTGIAVIVGLLAQARTQLREVTAYGLSDHYKEIFEITRLSDFMRIYDDEDSAVSGTPA